MYHDAVTLFCRYRSRLGDTWHPTLLQGVNLNTDRAAIVAKFGTESKDRAALHVKYHLAGGEKIVAGKIWRPPKEWNRLPDSQLPGFLTFTSGKDFDFFYAGAWENEIPIADEDYTDGFYSHMNARFDGVYAITGAGLYSVIPHFEITGA